MQKYEWFLLLKIKAVSYSTEEYNKQNTNKNHSKSNLFRKIRSQISEQFTFHHFGSYRLEDKASIAVIAFFGFLFVMFIYLELAGIFQSHDVDTTQAKKKKDN